MELYKSEKTKYDVPLNHLDYEYINKCQDVKEMEKIIKILRGGSEGHYPDLLISAEKKLESLNPESRVLRKEKPVANKKDLAPEERETIDTDIQNWLNAMKTQDLRSTSGSSESTTTDLPPVRGATNIPMDKKTAEKEEREKRKVLPRSHKEWDKVDIEAELAKVDDPNAKPTTKKLDHRDASLPSSVDISSLSAEEKTVKANREKDKGNEAFRAGDYEEALVYYNRSLSIQPLAAAYNNRAQTYLKTNKWKEAIRDCNKVLQLEPQNVKAILRRAAASQGMKDFLSAKKDLKFVLEADPANKKAKQILDEVEQSLSEQKVKGRRMVIEEVGSSEEDSEADDDSNPPPKVNGHAEPEIVKPVEKAPEEKKPAQKAPVKKKKVPTATLR